MLTTERTARIEAIRTLPIALEQAVANLTDKQLDTPYREGGWTVRQVVHHTADSHMNAFIRMKLALTEDAPTIKTYEQDEWARFVDTNTLPIESSLMILRGLHERWAALLESLPEESWRRHATHPENGVVTVDDLLKTYANHGAKHVGHITNLRRVQGW